MITLNLLDVTIRVRPPTHATTPGAAMAWEVVELEATEAALRELAAAINQAGAVYRDACTHAAAVGDPRGTP